MQPISLEFAASDSARAVLLALREILSERVLRDDLRIGFAFDEGERAVIDVRGGNVRLEPWSRDTPVSVLTTVPTMLDLLRGTSTSTIPIQPTCSYGPAIARSCPGSRPR